MQTLNSWGLFDISKFSFKNVLWKYISDFILVNKNTSEYTKLGGCIASMLFKAFFFWWKFDPET